VVGQKEWMPGSSHERATYLTTVEGVIDGTVEEKSANFIMMLDLI
jgi:hypothetical protein